MIDRDERGKNEILVGYVKTSQLMLNINKKNVYIKVFPYYFMIS